jgi:hypothetical protein
MSRINSHEQIFGKTAEPAMKKRGKAQANHCFAKCKIQPGLFRGEWLVSLEAMDPNADGQKLRVRLFADEREVTNIAGIPNRNQPASGLLRVSMVKRRGEFTAVVLPQPSQPIGPNIIMHNDDLVEAA